MKGHVRTNFLYGLFKDIECEAKHVLYALKSFAFMQITNNLHFEVLRESFCYSWRFAMNEHSELHQNR